MMLKDDKRILFNNLIYTMFKYDLTNDEKVTILTLDQKSPGSSPGRATHKNENGMPIVTTIAHLNPVSGNCSIWRFA